MNLQGAKVRNSSAQSSIAGLEHRAPRVLRERSTHTVIVVSSGNGAMDQRVCHKILEDEKDVRLILSANRFTWNEIQALTLPRLDVIESSNDRHDSIEEKVASLSVDRKWVKLIGDDYVTANAAVPFNKNVLFVPKGNSANSGYFAYNGVSSYAGLTQDGDSVSLVNEGYWTTVAHELSHGMCVRYDGGIGCDGIPSGDAATHFSCPDGGCTANIVGFNNIAQKDNNNVYLIGPLGPLSPARLPVMAQGVGGSYQDLSKQWIDPNNYNQLFSALRKNQYRSEDLEPGLRIGFSFASDGTLNIAYASPTLISPDDFSFGQSSDVSLSAIDSGGNTVFTSSAKLLTNERPAQLGTGNPFVASCPNSFLYEQVVPYGFNVAKLIIGIIGRGGATEVVPAVEVLRTQFDRLPDSAFNGSAPAQREAISSTISTIEQDTLNGNFSSAASGLQSLSLQVKSAVSASYIPQDPTQVSSSAIATSIEDASVHTAGGGSQANVKNNGLISITLVPPLAGSSASLFVGKVLVQAPSDPAYESVVKAAFGGGEREIRIFADGSFQLKLDPASYSLIGFQLVLRNRQEAIRLRNRLNEMKGQLQTLTDALAGTTDPDRQLVLEKLIRDLLHEIAVENDRYYALGSPMGPSLDFTK